MGLLAAWAMHAQKHSKRRADTIGTQIPLTEDRQIVICYFQATAKAFQDVLGWPIVDGTLPPKKRLKTLKDNPRVIATMRSILEGIDLREYQDIHFVELYPVPKYLQQVAGRFRRLGSNTSPRYTLWCLANTADERIVPTLINRMNEGGLVDLTDQTGLLNLLDSEQDETFLKNLHAKINQGADIPEDDLEGWF